jgi:hypothetical protein
MAWEWAASFIKLSTTCKSGVTRKFEVRVEPVSDSEWLYYVKPEGAHVRDGEEYLANFKQIKPDLLQLTNVQNGLPDEYQGCGITRALIPRVAKHHSTPITSSRNAEGEMRTVAATAVLQRMVEDGLALYESTEDRFYYPVPNASVETQCRTSATA